MTLAMVGLDMQCEESVLRNLSCLTVDDNTLICIIQLVLATSVNMLMQSWKCIITGLWFIKAYIHHLTRSNTTLVWWLFFTDTSN